jgi:hypothetical protein
MPKMFFKSMSRGRIFVDENLRALIPYLQNLNFRVRTPDPGMKDEEIKEKLELEKFVTNNSKDFRKDVDAYEYGLICTEKVTKVPKNLAKIISDAWRDFDLKSKHAFILELFPTGKHKLIE